MKTIPQRWLTFTAGALLALASPALHAKNLDVAHVDQRFDDANGNRLGDEWCWAATSKMVLDFYGYPKTLPEIVAHGLGDSTYDTWNYMFNSGSESRTKVRIWEQKLVGGVQTWVRVSKTVTLNWNGIDAIIKHFSSSEVQTQRHNVALPADDVVKEIDENDAPFFVRLGWDAGGGHFIVCYGTNAGTHSIHDPWFGSYLAGDAALRSGSGIDPNTNHTWTHTLTTSKILDVVFLFDTTGSMGGVLNNAKANANALLDKIASRFKNYRVAVANYKDFPQHPYGDPSDYVYQANVAFTTDKAAAQTAINGLSAAGGNDTPESVYTALSRTLAGDGLGTWRDNPARRLIILIADAPGHDPEPWSGGTSFRAVASTATNAAKPIAVHCLLVGTNIDANSQFKLIAGATGGSSINVGTASGVSPGLEGIVESVADSPRFPKDESGSIFPTFVFDPSGSGGMGPDAKSLLIEVQKFNEKKEKWARLRLISLKDPQTMLHTSKKAFATGLYRWRLGFKRPGGKLFLPALSDEKKPTIPVAAKTVFEPESEWTEFERVFNPPGNVTRLAPSNFFTATAKVVEYSFGTVPGATAYILEITHGSKVKRVTVRPPKSGDADVLTESVSGHVVDEFYSWRVIALNYDRPNLKAFENE